MYQAPYKVLVIEWKIRIKSQISSALLPVEETDSKQENKIILSVVHTFKEIDNCDITKEGVDLPQKGCLFSCV